MKTVTAHHITSVREQEELKLGYKLEVLLLVLKGEEKDSSEVINYS